MKYQLIFISRKINEKLQESVLKKSALTDYFQFDLNDTDAIPELMQQIFNRIEKRSHGRNPFLNNAGALFPIRLLHEKRADEAKNLAAPLVITAEFLKLTKILKTANNCQNVEQFFPFTPDTAVMLQQ